MFSKKDFLLKARERFDKRQANKGSRYQFTEHSRYKMQQYNLSEQRVTRIIRAPKRTEEGIAEKTIAVMQPGTVKRNALGKETWTQEIWVMFVVKKNHESRIPARPAGGKNQEKENEKSHDSQFRIHNSANHQIRIVSAWRYPGMSPKRNPIPEEILRELETGEVFDEE